ncbi:hypothetical protein [Mucilaginibacter sp. PAMB04168]|uniref:hypothetical protein n=1 Tax=Mucilaginibacter sp. PAMB04168 TaxID=3138567 RepID=UPI0031F65547
MIQADGTPVYHLCALKVQGNQLDISDKKAGLTTIEALIKALPEGAPVALNMSGKGVLIRQIPVQQEGKPLDFGQVLPNAKEEDFYVQNWTSGSQQYVAVIRKSEADKWLALLAKVKPGVLMLSLGPFPVSQVQGQLNSYGEELIFDGHQVGRDAGGNWTAYHFDPVLTAVFPIKLENEKLDEKLILPYAAALGLVLAAEIPPIEATVAVLLATRDAVLRERKVTVWSIAGLGVLFILLLINFGLFSYYNGENGRLAMQAGQTAQNSAELEKLSAQIQRKEALLDSLGWEGGINQSIRVDRLARLLPPEVRWQELAVNPEEASGGAEKPIHFQSRHVRVRGTSAQITPVNEWMGRVKILPWVKEVRLEQYNYNPERNSGDFTLIIQY